MEGYVSLYDKGKLVKENTFYKSRSHRERILERWRMSLGKPFKRMALHIFPITSDHLIKPNGKNSFRPYIGHDAPEKKSSIVRPPAKYDNIKTYEY